MARERIGPSHRYRRAALMHRSARQPALCPCARSRIAPGRPSLTPRGSAQGCDPGMPARNRSWRPAHWRRGGRTRCLPVATERSAPDRRERSETSVRCQSSAARPADRPTTVAGRFDQQRPHRQVAPRSAAGFAGGACRSDLSGDQQGNGVHSDARQADADECPARSRHQPRHGEPERERAQSAPLIEGGLCRSRQQAASEPPASRPRRPDRC